MQSLILSILIIIYLYFFKRLKCEEYKALKKVTKDKDK
jgi:hypothetical protein